MLVMAGVPTKPADVSVACSVTDDGIVRCRLRRLTDAPIVTVRPTVAVLVASQLTRPDSEICPDTSNPDEPLAPARMIRQSRGQDVNGEVPVWKRSWNSVCVSCMPTDGKVAMEYKASGIPQTVVIGKDGKVKKVIVGFGGEASTKELKDAVDAAMKAKD